MASSIIFRYFFSCRSELATNISEKKYSYIIMSLDYNHILLQVGLQLPMQSVPFTTDAVSSNLDQAEVYYIM
jgi:hypothetical protein